jgi:hypothetical protein
MVYADGIDQEGSACYPRRVNKNDSMLTAGIERPVDTPATSFPIHSPARDLDILVGAARFGRRTL